MGVAEVSNTEEPKRGSPEWYDRSYFFEKTGRGGYHWDDESPRGFYADYAELLDVAFGLDGKKMLDVGCAIGISIDEYRRRGADAWGTDISFCVETDCPLDVQGRTWQGDLGQPFEEWMARAPAEMPKRFDIVTAVETIEHTFPWRVPTAITNIARVTSGWLYASIPMGAAWDQNPEHLCIRPEEWWAAQFAEYAPWLFRREDRELQLPRIRLSDGRLPFNWPWPWNVLVYQRVSNDDEEAIARARGAWMIGESQHLQGKAIYDGYEPKTD